VQIIETLYDQILEDMNKESFSVSEKYKTIYDELGKKKSQRFFS
jgi:hypothetical protein